MYVYIYIYIYVYIYIYIYVHTHILFILLVLQWKVGVHPAAPNLPANVVPANIARLFRFSFVFSYRSVTEYSLLERKYALSRY